MTSWNLAQGFKGLKAIRRPFPGLMGGELGMPHRAPPLHFLETRAMQTRLSFAASALLRVTGLV